MIDDSPVLRVAVYILKEKRNMGGLGGLVVSAFYFQVGYRVFESRSGRDNFQTISTPSSYSTSTGFK